MTPYWHSKSGSDKLLLFFNGWGCNQHSFTGITVPGWDVLILSDYTQWEDRIIRDLDHYSEIRLLAWSFGVFMAGAHMMDIPGLTRRIAVNGTPWPIDDNRGIPVAIFDATLTQYNDENRKKFFRRVMGKNTEMRDKIESLPQRTWENQKEELEMFSKTARPGTPEYLAQQNSSPLWDAAIICESDKIFPPLNMKTAWGTKAEIIPGSHFPDFQHLIDQYILS